MPYLHRTWALKGHTPIIKTRLRHRLKVTVLGSLTISPQRRRCGLHAEFLPGRSVTSADLIAHLSGLRRKLGVPLVVVLDNLQQHKSKALIAWCEKVGDVHLEYLPPDAPELNPIEPAWSHGKCHTAAGRSADTAAELQSLAEEAIAQADQEHLLRGFVRSTKLPLKFDLPRRKDQSEAV